MMVRRGFQPCFRSSPIDARFFHLIHQRGDGIFGAIHPGILVIAAHNPFVGGSRRRESGR